MDGNPAANAKATSPLFIDHSVVVNGPNCSDIVPPVSSTSTPRLEVFFDIKLTFLET